MNGSVRLLVLLTKSDKLSKNEAAKSLTATQAVLAGFSSEEADIGICLFSALSGAGVADAAQALRAWTQKAAHD